MLGWDGAVGSPKYLLKLPSQSLIQNIAYSEVLDRPYVFLSPTSIGPREQHRGDVAVPAQAILASRR